MTAQEQLPLPEPESKRVEVSVLTDEDRTLISELQEALDGVNRKLNSVMNDIAQLRGVVIQLVEVKARMQSAAKDAEKS